MNRKHIPNAICVMRMLLVAPIAWSLLDERYVLGLALILAAGLSDVLDGTLARKYGWRTWLGGMLDPAADKLLLVSVFLTLTWRGLVPLWFTAVVVGRDLVIVAGTLAYHVKVERVHGAPTVVSKLNTVLQIGFVMLVIMHERFAWPPDVGLWLVGSAVLVTIAVSLGQYVVTGIQRTRESRASGCLPGM